MTAINVTGLRPYTNYTIHVRAIITAEALQNSNEILEGDANVEIVTRTHGAVPRNREVVSEPTSGPTATTIRILIPNVGQIDTGYVM